MFCKKEKQLTLLKLFTTIIFWMELILCMKNGKDFFFYETGRICLGFNWDPIWNLKSNLEKNLGQKVGGSGINVLSVVAFPATHILQIPIQLFPKRSFRSCFKLNDRLSKHINKAKKLLKIVFKIDFMFWVINHMFRKSFYHDKKLD